MSQLDRCFDATQKEPGIGHTKCLADDRKSLLKVFRWRAGRQMIGAGAGGRPLSLQNHTDERRRSKKFGQTQVTRLSQLSKLQTVDEGVAKLLEQV